MNEMTESIKSTQDLIVTNNELIAQHLESIKELSQQIVLLNDQLISFYRLELELESVRSEVDSHVTRAKAEELTAILQKEHKERIEKQEPTK